MLSANELKSIIDSGEGYNAEFKVRVPNKLKELSEEICAFANAAGGLLLIGIDDNNIVRGVELDNNRRSAIQNSLNEIDPHLPTELYAVEVDGKTVWVIEVNSGEQKPYALSGAIFVRQASNTQKLTSIEQMRQFFQQSDRIYFDESPCENFSPEMDIDADFFEEFRFEARLSKHITRQQIINNLRLTLPNGTMKNGAALFFGQQPEQFIETAIVRCLAFDGTDKTYIIDDKRFGGTLVHQYRQSLQWLKGKLNVRYKIEGSGPREEIWEIPETAFREAIINALSHRDYYDKGAVIHIEVFTDRVEITNPGGLVSAIAPEEFGTKSHSRNPLVFGLFERMHLVEKVGSGIGRIQNALKAASVKAAEFRMEGFFSVVFRRETVNSFNQASARTSKDIQQEILNLMKENPNITTENLCSVLNLTKRQVEYRLEGLVKNGLIKREGSKKSGSWVVLSR